MFGQKENDVKTADRDTKDEHAYEDNWYRSLKALAEQRNGESAEESSPEVEAEPQPSSPVAAEANEAAPETELETRAGQLLERLRMLQHLGDPEPAQADAPPASVRHD